MNFFNWSQIVKFFFKDSQLQATSAIFCLHTPPPSTAWAQKLYFFPPIAHDDKYQSVTIASEVFLSQTCHSLLRARIPLFLPL